MWVNVVTITSAVEVSILTIGVIQRADGLMGSTLTYGAAVFLGFLSCEVSIVNEIKVKMPKINLNQTKLKQKTKERKTKYKKEKCKKRI